MATWLTPKKAAEYIKSKNEFTDIKETTIRRFLKMGLPYVRNGNRYMINADTIDDNINLLLQNEYVKNNVETINGIRKINM